MQFLSTLNPQQQTAVTSGPGPVLVLAGPGAGKTRVLTTRIAYLVGGLGARPFNILAVTFTNKAAREMESRLEVLLGGQIHGLTLGTFHAVCARLLRREAELLPFDRYFVILDADDQVSLTKQALKDLNIDEKRFRAQGMLASISRAKNELVMADEYPVQTYRDEVVARVFRRYQELLLSSNALDFDDLLLYTARMLEENPAVRDKYARRYEHILVDEFQDTNMAQYSLLKHLASIHKNLFVVGDTDQSIYRWRGADYRNVMRFEQDFPEAQVVLLEQNYRSTQNILDTAMAVIEPNPHRTPKHLFTDRGAGPKIAIHECYDDREEATFTVDAIATLIASGEAGPGDFAVMYRTNAQSRLLEEAFLRANLPYRLVGAQRFYGRREVKDVIAYLRLIYNRHDEASLLRVINTPARRIGNKTLIALRTRAGQLNLTPGALLLDLARGAASENWEAFSSPAAQALGTFGALLARWQADFEDLSPLALMDRVLEDIDFRNYLDDGTDEGRDRWENVMELRRLAAEYGERGLTAFLEDVALISDQDTLDSRANVPTLLTLHAAKGLEFPIVIIVGLQEGTLPHIRSFEDPEAMAEERRLFYVGITRAKNRLFMIYGLNRSAYGYNEPTDSSRYLYDIPESLVVGEHPARMSGQTRLSRQRLDSWESAGVSTAPVVQPRYHPGDRIQHSSWGEGMVLNSKIQDDDEVVEIFFESVGLKRVSASIAKLEIL